MVSWGFECEYLAEMVFGTRYIHSMVSGAAAIPMSCAWLLITQGLKGLVDGKRLSARDFSELYHRCDYR